MQGQIVRSNTSHHSKTDVSIRKLKSFDQYHIIRIWENEVYQFFNVGTETIEGHSRSFIRRLELLKPPFVCSVATVENYICGWVSIAPITDHPLKNEYAGECSIYIDKQFRGMGIGQMLMEHMIAHSRQTSIQHIFAYVDPKNAACMKLMLKNDFILLGQLPQSGRHESPRIRNLLVSAV